MTGVNSFKSPNFFAHHGGVNWSIFYQKLFLVLVEPEPVEPLLVAKKWSFPVSSWPSGWMNLLSEYIKLLQKVF